MGSFVLVFRQTEPRNWIKFFSPQPMGTAKQEDKDSKSLRLDRQHFAILDDAELAFSNLHIGEGENKAIVRRHEFITPFQGMIMSTS